MKRIIGILAIFLMLSIGKNYGQVLTPIDASKQWSMGRLEMEDTIKLTKYPIVLSIPELNLVKSCFLKYAGDAKASKDDRAAYLAVEELLYKGSKTKAFSGNVSRETSKCIADALSNNSYGFGSISKRSDIDSLGKMWDMRQKVRDRLLDVEKANRISKKNSVLERQ